MPINKRTKTGRRHPAYAWPFGARAKRRVIALTTAILVGCGAIAVVAAGEPNGSETAAARFPARADTMTPTAVRVLPAPKPHMLGTRLADETIIRPIMAPNPVPNPAPGPAASAAPIAAPRMIVVRAIQQNLEQRGFAPGAVDGRLGPKTRAAIRAFQQACGLVVDGAVSERLIQRLVGTATCLRAAAQ